MVSALLLLLLILSGLNAPAASRASSERQDTLDVEELMGEIVDPGTDHVYLFEWLETLREHPRDLNTSDVDDLTEIPFLSSADAESIVRHRHAFGPFPSVDSLSAVGGLDVLVIRRIRPFLTVSERTADRAQAHEDGAAQAASSAGAPDDARRPRGHPVFRAQIIQRWAQKLDLADGFRRDSAGYVGGPAVLQTRVRLQLGPLTTSFTFDKDAGEPFVWHPALSQFGYDFLAGHLTAIDLGPIRRIVIGDYSVRFAFGNVLRSPGGIAASTSVPPVDVNTVRPFASSSEAGHFRGVAVEIEPVRHLSLSAFGSRRRFDARVDTTSMEESPLLLRRSTGLHRTKTELNGRSAFIENAAGGGIRVGFGPIVVAGIAYVLEDRLDDALLPVRHRIRQQSTMATLAAGISLHRLHISGEITPAGVYAAGAEFRAGRFGTVRTRIRRFRRSAYLPHSVQSSGSTGRVEPITEAATQVRIQPTSRTSLEAQMDITRRRAQTRRPPFPSVRASANIDIRHRVRTWFTASLRLSRRLSEEFSHCNATSHSATRHSTYRIRCLSLLDRRSLRAQLDYHHSSTLESRFRIEGVHARSMEPNRANGLLLYQELRFRPISAVILVVRLSNFSIDDHTARIYTYENDLLYAFSTPSFTGKGRRSFVFMRVNPSTKLSFEVKWSHSIWENVNSIGSGRDEINGNRVRELRLQMRWRPFG